MNIFAKKQEHSCLFFGKWYDRKNRRRRFLSYAGGKETKHSTICVEIWKIKLFVTTVARSTTVRAKSARSVQHHPRRGRARRAAPPPDRGGSAKPAAPSRRSSARSRMRSVLGVRRTVRPGWRSAAAFRRSSAAPRHPRRRAASPRGYLRAAVVFLTMAVLVVLFFIGDMIGWWPGLEDVLRATTPSETAAAQDDSSCTFLNLTPDHLRFSAADETLQLQIASIASASSPCLFKSSDEEHRPHLRRPRC